PPVAPADTSGVLAATADDAVAPLAAGTRQNVVDQTGNTAFVEITLDTGAQAIEFEWVMLVDAEQRQQLEAEAGDLMDFLTDSQTFELTGGEMLTFTVPPDLDADDAILDLVPADLRDLIDRNHVYLVQNTKEVDSGAAQSALLSLPMPAVCSEPVAVGVIDSAIDIKHPAFAEVADIRIHSRSFVDGNLVQPASHGTAVAAVLIGQQGDATDDASLQPLLPAATLYSAAVFHANEAAQQGATVMRILAALDWLVSEEEVHVINMSLAGPPNRLLAQAVLAASTQGKVIVAAVGNEGPHGPVRYPAAYAEVIGVTAVERNAGIYRWSNQGPQIDYAALGVEVPTARGDGSFGPESGTSIAAPVIAAFLACELAAHADVDEAIAALDLRLRDLGDPGRDTVFGKGLLHP
ncbi:MAG: S8 family serine peptidase, partial [Pseudomonadota bacterium]